LVKTTQKTADTRDMMISKEQARAAAEQLANRLGAPVQTPTPPVSPELLAHAISIACCAPASDEGRIAGARSFLAERTHDSRDVAAMMIQRIVSDSLR
jgi:hypothetical protein